MRRSSRASRASRTRATSSSRHTARSRSRASRAKGRGLRYRNEPVRGNGGLDLKWCPNENSALDATLNPDFSQIESDVAQISANNRFALFYPEKRPFFMERSQLFNSPIQAIYTRTITSPRWGARASGDAGRQRLDGPRRARTAAGERSSFPAPRASSLAPQDFSSFVAIGPRPARARRAVLREPPRDGSGGGREAATTASSGRTSSGLRTTRTRSSDSSSLSATADAGPPGPRRRTGTGGRSRRGRSRSSGTTPSTHWNWTGLYRDYGDGFRADVGYVPQVGIREGLANANYVFYTAGVLLAGDPGPLRRLRRGHVGADGHERRRAGSRVPGEIRPERRARLLRARSRARGTEPAPGGALDVSTCT